MTTSEVVALGVTVVVGLLGLAPSILDFRHKRQIQAFRDTRQHLSTHRVDLAWCAYVDYSDRLKASRVARVPLLTLEGWFPSEPWALDALTLEMSGETAGSDCSIQVRSSKLMPLTSPAGRHYGSYAEAIEKLDRPKLLWNGIVYRPLQVHATPEALSIEFTRANYFDYLDEGEILCFEAAKTALGRAHRFKRTCNPLRQSIADPFNLTRRCTSLGINVLTIVRRRDALPVFFMHERNAGKVASAMGSYHVCPAGEFQPSSRAPECFDADFSIWRTIMREYAEEFLGSADAQGRDHHQIDYDGPPFAKLQQALDQNQLKVWVLGLGLDPLSLKLELLCVALFEESAFFECFSSITRANEEGDLVLGSHHKGIDFDEAHIATYLSGESPADARIGTLPAGTGCLVLAMKHRAFLGLESILPTQPNVALRRDSAVGGSER